MASALEDETPFTADPESIDAAAYAGQASRWDAGKWAKVLSEQ